MANIEIKECKNCKGIMTDFRVNITNDEHFYCNKCYSHYHENTWYNPFEWEYKVESYYKKKKLKQRSKLT